MEHSITNCQALLGMLLCLMRVNLLIVVLVTAQRTLNTITMQTFCVMMMQPMPLFVNKLDGQGKIGSTQIIKSLYRGAEVWKYLII